MAIDVLLHEAQGLSEDALMEVIRFVRFIKSERENPPGKAITTDGTAKKKIRSAGKYRGAIKMADDFDAPLEEFRGYM